MVTDQKNCKVNIFDTSYVLASAQSEELIKQSAALVDEVMHEVAPSNHSASDVRQIAVLAALRLACRLILLEKEMQEKERNLLARIDKEFTHKR